VSELARSGFSGILNFLQTGLSVDPRKVPFMVDEAYPAWLRKLMKTSHSVWRLARWRGLVHGLATLLVLIAAETLIGGQQQQTSVLEIPKFFTERGPNGITTTTGDSYWLASRYVDHRVLTAIETVDDDEYFTGWSSMTDFYPPYRDGKSNRENLAAMLLTVLNDPETQKLAKCCAAAYLGILRAPETASSLAANITNTVPRSHFKAAYNPACGSFEPFADALVAIGIPAIPALIRNLGESDDTGVRRISLRVLARIENDQDILQLRLKKAFAGETDPRKKARLQLALQTIAENPNGE